jgi:hypothetical protein
MMVLMKSRLARRAQAATSSRLAFCFERGGAVRAAAVAALMLALTDANSASAQASKAAAPAAGGAATPAGAPGAQKSAADPEQAERLARRRERLDQGAKRLRDRAAELRKRIANGETVAPQPPNSKRPPRSLEEQAQRFEEQANRMEQRAKNLDSDTAGGGERTPEHARQRRHQLRRSHLNRRWGGPTLRDPEAAAELKVHAERVARLKRIRSLAMEKGKDDPLAKRAKELLNREEDRHEQHMKTIQARVAPAAASATTTTAAAPAEPAAAPAEEAK